MHHCIKSTVDVETCKKAHSQINHLYGSRNDASLAAKPPKPMALPRIIALYSMRLRFRLDQHLLWDEFSVRFPTICKKYRDIKSFQTAKQFC
jgi:hypothetical protein